MPKIPIQIARRTIHDPNASINDFVQSGGDNNELKRRIDIRKEFIENLSKTDSQRRVEMLVSNHYPIRSSLTKVHVPDRNRMRKESERKMLHSVMSENRSVKVDELKEKVKDHDEPQVLPSFFKKEQPNRVVSIGTENFGKDREFVDLRSMSHLNPHNNPSRKQL